MKSVLNLARKWREEALVLEERYIDPRVASARVHVAASEHR